MFELNDETRFILGRPCFVLIRTASILRENGYEIARQAEDEQAVSIYWMLEMYEKHGENWREECRKWLEAHV